MRKKILTISILINIIFVFAFFGLIHQIGGWNHFLYKVQQRGLAGTYQHRTELLDELSVQETDIIFLGNSLTQFGEWTELIDKKLQVIKNRGIAGDGVEGVLKRIPTILNAHPKAIFFMVGVNDLFYHDPEFVLEHYKSILQTCKERAPETQIILQSLLPVNDQIKSISIKNKDIQTVNKSIERLAKDYNYSYLNLYDHFKNQSGKLSEEFTVDGIHINGNGYLLWRDLILTNYEYLFTV